VGTWPLVLPGGWDARDENHLGKGGAIVLSWHSRQGSSEKKLFEEYIIGTIETQTTSSRVSRRPVETPLPKAGGTIEEEKRPGILDPARLLTRSKGD